MKTFFLFFIMMNSLAFGNDPECNPQSGVLADSFTQIAKSFSETCSEHYQRTPTSLMSRRTPEEICQCLKANKFNELRIPEEAKNAFDQSHVNASIGKRLNFAFNDLLDSITKFKNLNLTESLHAKSKTMCSPKKIVDAVLALKGREGTADCPGSAEQFSARLKNIWGEIDIEKLPDEFQNFNLGVDSKSCISRQKYLHLRSASKSSKTGLQMINGNPSALKDYFLRDLNGAPELLNYDLFISLGFKNPKFKRDLAEVIRKNITSAGELNSLDEHIYTDPEALETAFKSLEETCTQTTAQLKNFLCSPKPPVLNASNLSLAIGENIPPEGDDTAALAVQDYFVKRYSCKEETQTPDSDIKLNTFFETNALFARIKEDAVSSHPDSDYSKFNQTFCKSRAGRLIADSELPLMMKVFFDEKAAAGINLREIFADPETAMILNLNINPDADPAFSRVVRESGMTKLPEIYEGGWTTIAAKLLSKGMSQTDIDQLYSIIEMQTNVRNAEIRSVRERFIQQHPEARGITPAQVDGLLRQDPATIREVSSQYPTVSASIPQVQEIYYGQEAQRAERFEYSTPMRMVGAGAVQTAVNNLPSASSAEASQVPTNEILSEQRAARTEEKSPTPKPRDLEAPSLTVSSRSFGSSYRPTSSSTSSSSSSDSSFSDSSSSVSSATFNGNESQSTGSVTNNRSRSFRGNAAIDEANDDIRRMQEEMDRNRAEYERTKRQLAAGTSSRVIPPIARSNGRSQNSSGYQYPKNLPVKDQNGDYYEPEAQGSELSSASNKKAASDESGSWSVGAGSSERRAKGSAGGGVSFGSVNTAGGGASSSGSRGPASENTLSLPKELLNLAPFEHNRFIPHSIFDVVGSIDKVIMLLGLEGKSFKTIEAIEEPEKATGKIIIKYYERSFDFVPSGKFEKFKDLFADKNLRADAFKQYFTFPRTKQNLPLSKQYSIATKQIKKEEVSHSYVLKIQNFILSDAEIQATMNKTMELMK